MSLSDLASLGSFVSGIAILVSLVYAGLQLRAFTIAAHESRYIAWTSDVQQFRMAIATDPEVARIYRDGCQNFDGLENIDKWRFGALMQSLVSNFALVSEFNDIPGHHELDHNIRWILGRPGARAWWPGARHMFSSELVARVDHALAESKEG